jgi:hypothetical protein
VFPHDIGGTVVLAFLREVPMRTRQAVMGGVLAASLFMVAAPALAQPAPSKLPVTFDVVGGINVATVSFPLVPPEFDALGFDFSVGNRVGFVGGVLIGIPVADGVAVETGALLSFKGASLKITIPEIGTATGNLNLTYLDVPGLGRFRVVTSSRTTLHALAGVTMGLKLNAEQSASFMGETITEDLEGVSGFDLGLTFGGRVEIGRGLVDVRYTFGMLNLAEESGLDGETIKNRTWSFMAGWRF